eukprot:CAMPEP_0179177132 /NCGR_PEP_ID=MMETSP0796-20121207/87595_1 /TAXON_ID=73915 /ORGANISM="Pyrodinium bahamense, Strain pbaha01" /LENGTH=129 /DNA_ID=CAMNT_0020880679 /DNA_START=187 /DNA_END=573 /DNA_ORIENTATION=-
MNQGGFQVVQRVVPGVQGAQWIRAPMLGVRRTLFTNALAAAASSGSIAAQSAAAAKGTPRTPSSEIALGLVRVEPEVTPCGTTFAAGSLDSGHSTEAAYRGRCKSIALTPDTCMPLLPNEGVVENNGLP